MYDTMMMMIMIQQVKLCIDLINLFPFSNIHLIHIFILLLTVPAIKQQQHGVSQRQMTINVEWIILPEEDKASNDALWRCGKLIVVFFLYPLPSSISHTLSWQA